MAEEKHEEVKPEVIPVTLPGEEVKPGDKDEAEPKGEITEAEAKEVAEGKFVTIKQLAHTLGYSAAWITVLVQGGKIHAVKPLGGQWRIPQAEVKRLTNQGLKRHASEAAVDATKIKVTGEHHERVTTTPEDKKEEEPGEKQIPWPLSVILK